MIEKLVNRVSVTRPEGGERIETPCLGEGDLVVALCPSVDDHEPDRLTITAPLTGAKVGPGYDFEATNDGLKAACEFRDALLKIPVRWNAPFNEYEPTMREHMGLVSAVLRKENIRRQHAAAIRDDSWDGEEM